MAAPHAAEACFYRPTQNAHGDRMVIAMRFPLYVTTLGIVGEKFGNNIVVFANHVQRRVKADNLFRFQLDIQLRRHLFGGEIETFANDRNRHRPRRTMRCRPTGRVVVNRLIINTADTAAVAAVTPSSTLKGWAMIKLLLTTLMCTLCSDVLFILIDSLAVISSCSWPVVYFTRSGVDAW